MDKYRIEGHKLNYHVARVNDWLRGENIYPIYMEISPAGSCNHRCTFCALDFVGYQKRYLDVDMLKERIAELGKLGVRSIMFGGEGEPLLHPHIVEIMNFTKESGIDVALTTNGVFLEPAVAREILGCTEWIKVSINAGTPETYGKIHRTAPADLEKVFANLEQAALMRRENKLRCTLGMQMVLLPENWNEAPLLAGKAKEVGMDYLVVKPYSQHQFSKTSRYSQIRYSDYRQLNETLKKYNDSRFEVIFRQNTMEKWDKGEKAYSHCLAMPFWAYIDSGGNVWGCSAYLMDDKFCYGNLYDQTFHEIWGGEKRGDSLEWVKECLETRECRINCRMDEINRYLWDLRNPPLHVNFI